MDADLTFAQAVRPALIYTTAPISMWAALDMSEDMHQQLGRHGAEIQNLQRDITEIKKDLHGVVNTLAEARGGWRTLMLVAGVAGAVGAIMTKLALVFGFVK